MAFLDDRAARARVERYATAASALGVVSDQRLREVLEGARFVGSGIGGTSMLLDIEDIPVFVKRVALTDLERRPENLMSTANLFGLPVWCQYGVGSPGFGVWREVAAHVLTTSWVVSGRCETFPLMYHWRVLDGAPPAVLSEELADTDRVVQFWHGSDAVRQRVQSIKESTATVTLFLEHVPMTLPDWLKERVSCGDRTADAAIGLVERHLLAGVAFMNAAGLFHFDAHFGNILTDGERLYLADFGLANSTRFELSPGEARFLAANRTHDACHTITRLVDWLVTEMGGIPDWRDRDDFIRRCAEGVDGANAITVSPGAADVIARYAPIAVIVNEFYRRLHLEDRTTQYPVDEIQQACARSGLKIA